MADGGLYSITGSDDGKGVGLAPLGIGETAFFAGDPAIEEDWLTAPWVVTHTGDMFIGGPSGYKFNTEGFAHNGANLLSATNINSNLKIGNTGISLQQLVDWYNSSGPGATDPEEPIE